MSDPIRSILWALFWVLVAANLIAAALLFGRLLGLAP